MQRVYSTPEIVAHWKKWRNVNSVRYDTKALLYLGPEIQNCQHWMLSLQMKSLYNLKYPSKMLEKTFQSIANYSFFLWFGTVAEAYSEPS